MAKKKAKKRDKKISSPAMLTYPSNSGDNVVEHRSIAPCSIEFNRDAKGQARWSIKAYGEVSELDDVRESVLAQDKALRDHESRND